MSTNPTAKDEGFIHRLRWDRLQRQGQSCRILRANNNQIHVEFEDGYKAILPRRALVRRADLKEKNFQA